MHDAKHVLLDLNLGPIAGPESLGLPTHAREMGIFNPSLARAPKSLCPRCRYVAALRVDPLHQCHDASPLLKPDEGMPKNIAANAFFKGTAIAILDRDLSVIGWTWLLNAPQHQVSSSPNPSRWFVPLGVAGQFPPPWAKAVYDVRVIGIDERLFVSYVCRKCAFSVAQLQVTASITADGGVTSLRAWQSRRYSSTALWAQGRNQALFVASRTAGGRSELMVQPWMGIVASFGAPTFGPQTILCKRGSVRLCGASPPGTQLDLEKVLNERKTAESGGFGWLEQLANSSHPLLRKAAIGGHRLSTTSNLVTVSRADGCIMHLGVGHVHRSEGKLNKAMFGEASGPRRRRGRRRQGESNVQGQVEGPGAPIATSNGMLAATATTTAAITPPSPSSFMWGYQYTHFFYALEPHSPFRVIATSREFCLPSEQDSADCESIQFISGLNLVSSEPASTESSMLLISYGVNDCEAKVARLPLQRALGMLNALPGLDAGSSAAIQASKCFARQG